MTNLQHRDSIFPEIFLITEIKCYFCKKLGIMAETLSEIFERMLQKQQILVDKYHALKRKNGDLEDEKKELEKELQKQKAEIEKLQMENQYLKIARTIAPDQNALEKSRELVSKLVRDVEKCIERLSDS